MVENKRHELTDQQAKLNGSEPPQATPPVVVPSVEAIVARFPNTVVVGNTVRTVAVAAVAETTPALAVVPHEDPVAALDPRRRLVTFG